MIEPFTVLAEAEDLPRWDTPEQLVALYGGAIGIDEPCVVANFVESRRPSRAEGFRITGGRLCLPPATRPRPGAARVLVEHMGGRYIRLDHVAEPARPSNVLAP